MTSRTVRICRLKSEMNFLICHAAPLTIVKKGAVIAKGKFNYQNGVQWITFNYEGKKQNGNLHFRSSIA